MTTSYRNPDEDGEVQQDCEPLLGDYTTLDETHISLAPDHGSKILTFNSGPRPYRDTIFAFLFIGTVLITYALGFYAVKNADFDLESQLELSRYNPTSGQCEVVPHDAYAENTSSHIGTLLQQRIKSFVGDIDPAPTFIVAVLLLVPILGTLLLVTPAGFFMLWILHHYTLQAVFAAVLLQCFIPLAVLLSGFTLCFSVSDSDACLNIAQVLIPYFVIIPVITVCSIRRFVKEWSRVQVVIRNLKPTLHALRQNLSLLMLYPIMSLAVILIDGTIINFIVCASNNGKISPDFDAIESSHDGCSQSTGPPCCRIEQAEWVVAAYRVLAWVAALWVMLVTIYLHHFVVSGAIAEWRATPAGSSTTGFTKRSLRNALGPSFGTICQSATLVTPVLTILNCLTPKWACSAGLFQLVEPFTPRKWHHAPCEVAAISGEGFFNSARISFDLWRRSCQSTVDVEIRVVNQAAGGLAFVFSFLHFFMVFGTMYYLTTAGGIFSQEIALLCAIILQFGIFPFHSVSREDIIIACYGTSNHNEEQ